MIKAWIGCNEEGCTNYIVVEVTDGPEIFGVHGWLAIQNIVLVDVPEMVGKVVNGVYTERMETGKVRMEAPTFTHFCPDHKWNHIGDN